MPKNFAMTEPPQPAEAGATPGWFVQAAGQVWGPYSAVRVARFVAEGRVTPDSFVSPQSEGPFHPAGRWRGLAHLFHASKPYQHQPAPVRSPETPPEPVWAELVSLSADQFEALLARHGAVVAIRPTVWLVQARRDPAALRNVLSRRLTGADALMIVHAPLDQAAWFNLDSAAERKLRQVWGGGG
jgi:hypothetical protein